MENNNKKLKIFLIISIVVAVLAVAGLVTTIIITNNMKNNDLGDNNVIEENEEIEQENSNLNEDNKEETNNSEEVKIALPTDDEVMRYSEIALTEPSSPILYASEIYGQTINQNKIVGNEIYTGVKYSDFENKVLSMFTKEYYENKIRKFASYDVAMLEKNGELVVYNLNKSGNKIDFTEVKLVSNSDGKAVYNLTGSKIVPGGNQSCKYKVEFVLNDSKKYVFSNAIEEKDENNVNSIALPTNDEVMKYSEIALTEPSSPILYASEIYGQTINQNKIVGNEIYTGVKYSDFENKVLSMFTKEYYENKIRKFASYDIAMFEKNGELVVYNLNKSGNKIDFTEAKLVSNSDGKAVYNLTGSKIVPGGNQSCKYKVEFVLNDSKKYVFSNAVEEI